MRKLNRKNTIAKWLKQICYISLLLMISSIKYDFFLKQKVKNGDAGS